MSYFLFRPAPSRENAPAVPVGNGNGERALRGKRKDGSRYQPALRLVDDGDSIAALKKYCFPILCYSNKYVLFSNPGRTDLRVERFAPRLFLW